MMQSNIEYAIYTANIANINKSINQCCMLKISAWTSITNMNEVYMKVTSMSKIHLILNEKLIRLIEIQRRKHIVVTSINTPIWPCWSLVALTTSMSDFAFIMSETVLDSTIFKPWWYKNVTNIVYPVSCE